MISIYSLFIFFQVISLIISIPPPTTNWDVMFDANGVSFSGRNCHASAVFNNKAWVIGGRVDSYTRYDLRQSQKQADVWYSEDGESWDQITDLKGDFFAQNDDVVQPGSIAPFYERFGHTLTTFYPEKLEGNQGIISDISLGTEIMLLMGGFSPNPSNDIWATEDGTTWIYCGNAPWSARAWHSVTVFNGSVYVMGGTPLNNEVWKLTKFTRTPRREPLTRAMYYDYTFSHTWQRMPNAPWSPRVGMSVVTQKFNQNERILLIGGYGGWLHKKDMIKYVNNHYLYMNSTKEFLDTILIKKQEAAQTVDYSDIIKNINNGLTIIDFDPKVNFEEDDVWNNYDGFRCRSDTWETYDGIEWKLVNESNAFGERAWASSVVHIGEDDTKDAHFDDISSPKIYLFGGGMTGFDTKSKKKVTSVKGRADAYFTIDGGNWTKISYEEGGGKTTVPFYSSQEWSKITKSGRTNYLGVWGQSSFTFNRTTKSANQGDIYITGGYFAEGGSRSAYTYRSARGLFCDIGGIACNSRGSCNDTIGCSCNYGYAGSYCEIELDVEKGEGYRSMKITNIYFFLFISIFSLWFLG